MTNIIDINEYRATERANARMMDTTIWQAMRITGMSDKDYRTSEIFHKLFLLYHCILMKGRISIVAQCLLSQRLC